MAIVAMLTPFALLRVNEMSASMRDMGAAREILHAKDSAAAFVRLNRDSWPDTAQIKMSEEDLAAVAPGAHAGFIDKYLHAGSPAVDVYLAYHVGDALRASKITRDIGAKFAAVMTDGAAYGDSWAVSGDDFNEGDLILRVNRAGGTMDKSRYLHRGTDGEDGLNTMQRDLNMGLFDIYAAGRVVAESVKALEISAGLLSAEAVISDQVYFSRGATISGEAVKFGNVRVMGDMTGFRAITAAKLNGEKYGTDGTISTDRATITKVVNVGKELILKSSSVRTISGFVGMSAHSLLAPYLSANELYFMGDFGLVVSSELLLSSSNSPLKLGGWSFPGTKPKFSKLSMARGEIAGTPDAKAFDKIIEKHWKDRRRAN
jgi:hypothetical protein